MTNSNRNVHDILQDLQLKIEEESMYTDSLLRFVGQVLLRAKEAGLDVAAESKTYLDKLRAYYGSSDDDTCAYPDSIFDLLPSEFPEE